MTPDRAPPAAIARGIPSAHKKTGRLGLPVQNQSRWRKI
jgi:hypothetical protein